MAYRETRAAAAAAAATASCTATPTVGRGAVHAAIHPRCRRLSPTDDARRRRRRLQCASAARRPVTRVTLVYAAPATWRHRQRSL